METLVPAKPIIVIDEKRKFTPIERKPADKNIKKGLARMERRRVRIDDLEDEDLGYHRDRVPAMRPMVAPRGLREESDSESEEELDEFEIPDDLGSEDPSDESEDEEPLARRRAEPVANTDAGDADYAENLPEGEAELAFWDCLKSLRWTHRTDGVMNIRQVTNWYKGLNGKDRAVFDRIYDPVFTRLFNHLELFFAARNIKDIDEKNKIVSHFVAIGNDNYNSVIDSAELIDYFIGENDCQNFDSMLPEHLQH